MTNIGHFKKGLAIMLVTLMVFTMLPGGLLEAKAAGEKATLSIGDGSIVIGDGTVTQNGTSLTYNSNGYIITGSGTTTNTISVTGGSHNITLSGVNIDVSNEGNIYYGVCPCAFSISSGASVNLALGDTNTLKSGRGRACLEVPEGALVSIAGTGSLTAVGGNSDDMSGDCSGAGIGSGYDTGCGIVNISGGTITATGGSGDSGRI